MSKQPDIHATTVLVVRRGDQVALASDGQVTFGHTVLKHTAKKVRTLYGGKVLAGFAGAVSDAFALFQRFEAKLEEYRGNLERASVELVKEWRTDRALRRLEAMLAVADHERTFLLSGTGELIEPDEGVLAIGSGGPYALAAARALMRNTDQSAEDITRNAMAIAGEICIYSNDNLSLLTLDSSGESK